MVLFWRVVLLACEWHGIQEVQARNLLQVPLLCLWDHHVFKVCRPYTVTFLIRHLFFQWYIARFVVMNGHQHHMLRWRWTMSSKFRHHSTFNSWHTHEGLCDYLKRESSPWQSARFAIPDWTRQFSFWTHGQNCLWLEVHFTRGPTHS